MIIILGLAVFSNNSEINLKIDEMCIWIRRFYI